MAKRLPLTDNDGEVRELTNEDFKQFKPAAEILPAQLLSLLPRRGRPQAVAPKQAVNLRLAPEILEAFRATGKGWQTRINDALRDWLKEHKPA